MNDTYQKLFNMIEETPFPQGLKEAIWKKIEAEAKKQRRIQMGMYISASFASGFGMVFLFTLLLKSLAASGIYEYLSLIVSDGGTLISFWKEFALTFMESLPVLGLTAFLAVGALFLWSGARLLRTVRPSVLIVHS